MRILVTGGAGFIGSHFIKYTLATYPEDTVLNFDTLTYAGNPANLTEVAGDPRYRFIKGDICDARVVTDALADFQPDAVVNFAAESHVDRSMLEPEGFVKTNVLGVMVLAEASRAHGIQRFVQVSTDEVYGEALREGFRETDVLTPRSTYSASKAGGELLARAYFFTRGLPVVITRGTNAYGPNQYPEKFIALATTNLLEGKKIPVYGDGLQVRDWLYVRDFARGVDTALRKGYGGEIYNLGAEQEEWTNIDVARCIARELGKTEDSIEYVKDRPGHDKRYRLHCDTMRVLGWKPEKTFAQGLRETVQWYKAHEDWWKPLKSGEYLEYYKKQYAS